MIIAVHPIDVESPKEYLDRSITEGKWMCRVCGNPTVPLGLNQRKDGTVWMKQICPHCYPGAVFAEK